MRLFCEPPAAGLHRSELQGRAVRRHLLQTFPSRRSTYRRAWTKITSPGERTLYKCIQQLFGTVVSTNSPSVHRGLGDMLARFTLLYASCRGCAAVFFVCARKNLGILMETPAGRFSRWQWHAIHLWRLYQSIETCLILQPAMEPISRASEGIAAASPCVSLLGIVAVIMKYGKAYLKNVQLLSWLAVCSPLLCGRLV